MLRFEQAGLLLDDNSLPIQLSYSDVDERSLHRTGKVLNCTYATAGRSNVSVTWYLNEHNIDHNGQAVSLNTVVAIMTIAS